MTWVFVAFALFGGAFLLPMLLGGLDTGDLDIEFDGDLEVGDGLGEGLEIGDGADAGTSLGGSGVGEALGDLVGGLLSLRSIVMFSAFFGLSGLVLEGAGYPAAVGLPTAVLIGLFAAVVNSALYGFLVRSQANSQITDRSLEGRPGHVVLPIEDGRKGKVRIDLGGQPHFIVARSYDDRVVGGLEVGEPVVVVQVEEGTALVAPVPELA